MPRFNIDTHEAVSLNNSLIEARLDPEKDTVIRSAFLQGILIVDVCEETANKLTALLMQHSSVVWTQEPENAVA